MCSYIFFFVYIKQLQTLENVLCSSNEKYSETHIEGIRRIRKISCLTKKNIWKDNRGVSKIKYVCTYIIFQLLLLTFVQSKKLCQINQEHFKVSRKFQAS